MMSFYEFVEAKAIGSGLGSRLAGRAASAAGDVATDAGAAVATGGMSLIPGLGGVAKAAVGAMGDLGRAWRERAAVRAAADLARKTISSKGAARDPQVVQRIVDSYTHMPDEFLKHLSASEQDQIASSLMDAIKAGSVQDHHAQLLAVDILKRKADEITALVRSAGGLPNVRMPRAV